MSTEEGVSLLLRGYEGVNKDDHMLEGSKIVARLGGLALAIDQAAAYINYKRLPVERLPYFLTVYEAERKKILKYTPDNFWEYGTMQLHGKADQNRAISAFTTWEMSFQQLESDDEQRKKDIAHFLTLSAFFDPANIGESLFRYHWTMTKTRLDWMEIFVPVEEVESGDETSSEEEQTKSRWDAERFWDLLHWGHDLSLLQSISNGGGNEGASFSLHPLIRDWLQLRETSKQRRLYTKEGIDFVVSSIQEYKTLTTTPQQRRLLMAHMDACLSNDERFSGYKRSLGYEIGTCDVASWFADFYSYQGRYKMSEKLLHLIVETRKELLGLEHPDTQTSMASLTLIYQNQGRWKEAETLGVQVTEVMKRVLGEKHPETLRSMATLAVTYQNQGRWKAAETLEVQIASTMESVLGKEHPTTLNSMGNLASTYRNQGLWEEAETLELQVIEIMKRVLGEEHPDTLTAMANLALTYKDQGRWKEAETLEVQVTKIMRSVLGEEHHLRLMGMAILASIYHQQERWKEAETLGVQVTEIMKRVMGEEHPDTLTSMGDLALAYQNLGRWKEAKTLAIQVMKISMKVLGEEHSHTLTSMGNLASIYRDQRRWKEAEELEVQVMETRKRVLGLEHPDTLTSMDNVASAFGGQGWWKEAEKLDVQVMVCAGCGSDKAKGGSGPLKKCGRCKKARYCSAECQKADWKQHKVICRK